MLYLCHGNDEFGREEWLAKRRAAVSDDAGMAALNIARLAAQNLTANELRSACAAVSFFVERRLVIVDGLAARFEGRSRKRAGARSASKTDGERQELLDYLGEIPESTELVLNELDTVKSANPLLQRVTELKGKVMLFQAPRPDSNELRRWAQERAQRYGLRFVRNALDGLLANIGNDLRLIDNELQKLAAYAGSEPVSEADVQLLVASVREGNVFAAMDSVGRRDGAAALRNLRGLLAEGQPAQYLFTMLVRQLRLILQARDALDRGVPPQRMSEELGIASYPAEKAANQARNFNKAELLRLYDRLVEIDYLSKTGNAELEAEMEAFVYEVGRRR